MTDYIIIPKTEPLAEILDALNGTEERLKVVDPDNLHITLKFLGDIYEETIPNLIKSVKENIGASSFNMTIKGTGSFGKKNSPSVLWASVQDNGNLSDLAQTVEDSLSKIGFEREKRRFKPHSVSKTGKTII